jgi:hypothetical protein
MNTMDEASITRYITDTFAEVEITNNFGYTFFFYRTDHTLPFATLISSDFEYDHVSNLDRPGMFRLNIGISRQTFQALFGTDRVDISSYDYTAADTIMPHPEYAPQSFVCVLNPSGTTLEKVQQLLAEAYEIAVNRYNRRKAH